MSLECVNLSDLDKKLNVVLVRLAVLTVCTNPEETVDGLLRWAAISCPVPCALKGDGMLLNIICCSGTSERDRPSR